MSCNNKGTITLNENSYVVDLTLIDDIRIFEDGIATTLKKPGGRTIRIFREKSIQRRGRDFEQRLSQLTENSALVKKQTQAIGNLYGSNDGRPYRFTPEKTCY